MHNLAQIDKKMLSRMDSAYGILHLDGYYHGKRDVALIKRGFEVAREIIEKIKPEKYLKNK